VIQRRRNVLRVAFWTCGVATLALCMASCVQTPYYAMASSDGARGYEISIFCGDLCIESQPDPPPKLGWHQYSIGQQTEPYRGAWVYATSHRQPWGYTTNANQMYCASGLTAPFVRPIYHWIVIPLWLPMALWAGFVFGRRAIRFLLADARFVAGQCPACGYDLTGNASGRCPECGQRVANSA
jgi:hypothetical protein